MNISLLVLIAAFLLAMICIGIWAGKKQKTAEDFLVAGRRFGVFTSTATQIATAFGGGVMLAQVGIAYSFGFSVLIYSSISVAGGVFLLAWFARWMRRQNFFTTTDWMCAQYGETKLLRGLTSFVVSLYSMVGWVAQPIAAGKILEVVTGLPIEYGIALAAIVVIIYTMTGGIAAVAYTDIAQMILMLLGVFVLLPTVLIKAGGLGNVFATVPSENLTLTAVGNDVAIAWLLAVLPAQMVKQTYHQRVFSARDEKTARQGLFNLAFATVLIGFWAALLGMAIFTLNPDLPDQEHATIWVIKDALHPIVAAFALAAIVAAVVSTADSFLHSASASLTRDFYQMIFRPRATDREIVLVSKISIVIIGLAGIAIGILMPSVLQALLLGYSLTAAGLVFPLFLGYFWSGANRLGAIAGMLAGVSFTIFFKFNGGLPAFLPPVGAGLCASLIATVFFSLLSPSRNRQSPGA